MHYRLLLIAAVALAACRGPSVAAGRQSAPATRSAAVSPNSHDHVAPASNDPLPVKELEKARRATARYQDVNNALADGYKDINVVLPNMGRHFLKEAQLDATFDAERPELLVYKEEHGWAPDARGAGVCRAAQVERDSTRRLPGRRGRVVRGPEVPALDAACVGLERESGRRLPFNQQAGAVKQVL